MNDVISDYFDYHGYSIQYCGGMWLLYGGREGYHVGNFRFFPNVLKYIEQHPAKDDEGEKKDE